MRLSQATALQAPTASQSVNLADTVRVALGCKWTKQCYAQSDAATAQHRLILQFIVISALLPSLLYAMSLIRSRPVQTRHVQQMQ
jgi:hypothetical protein